MLGSIGVRFHNIADTSSAGSELIVTLNADNNGNPADSALCTLTDPTTFSASGMHTFTAPTTGTDRCPLLAASTNYFVVVQRVAGNTDQISLSVTQSSSEDSGGAANWSIGDGAKYLTGSSWLGTNTNPHMIEVKGAVIVPPPRVTGFDLHSDNSNPKGIWGNDDYFWVSPNGSTDKLFAYNRSDGSRASSQDFNTLSGAGNDTPTGICSDGTTMFVADFDDTKVYAYDLSTKAHDSTKDINLATANNKPEGVWCDATYVWVVDDDTVSNGNDIFAYNRADGTQNTDVDFTDIDDSGLNANPRDIYSNGTTMFVVDDEDAEVYAWKMSDQTRSPGYSIALDSDNADPEGLWFDGRVLWVVDDSDDEVYVYDLPGAQPDNTVADGSPVIRTPTSEDVWTATLTAGTNTSGVGYITDLDPDVGSLSPATFTVDGVTYTVTNLYDSSASANEGVLAFGVDKEMPQGFTLSVAGTSYSSGNALRFSGTSHHEWFDANLSWSASDTISVILSVDTAPEEGVELTAHSTAIDDTDGLADAFFHYQWIRVDGTNETDLDGERGSTYTPTADDVDKSLKVRVVFDDDAGNQEYPRTSRQIGPVMAPPNNPASGAPSISGVLQQNDELTADTVGIADADGLGNFSYQWLADGTAISGATSSMYTLTSAEVGKAISLTVTFTDGEDHSESLTSAATYNVVASGATRRLHWLATMEVGSVPGDPTFGYYDQPGQYGSISVAKFSAAGVEYAVGLITYNRATLPEHLLLRMLPAFPGQFTLHTGSVATGFASQDAAESTVGGNQQYAWANTFPGWSDGQQVAVFLTEPLFPAVTVSFEQASYSVAEGDTVTVKVELNVDPEREVVVPLTRANQGGASNGDYSGVPANVTFQSGDTEKSFTFAATQDTANDDGESVRLGLGTLPAGVTAGATDESTVSITDDDDPAVTVSFEQGTYSVAEGDTVTVKVELNVDPEREVVVPLTRANQGGASNGDYSGVPANVTFQSGDTEKSFTFAATQDTANDDGESVRLGLGTLPARVTAGATDESTVSIIDDDEPVSISQPPTVSAAAQPGSITAGGTVTLNGTASDPNGDALTYAWTSSGGGTFANDSALDTTWTAPTATAATVYLTLTVTDTGGLSASYTVSVVVVTAPGGGDGPGVTITPTQMTIAEGQTSTYTVALARQPSSKVAVALEPQRVGTTGRSVHPNTYRLTFTRSNWHIPQTVTVEAQYDDDANEDVVPIRHKIVNFASASEYRNLSIASVTVTVPDSDPQPAAVLSIGPSETSVNEGGSIVVTVYMSTAHSEAVNVRVGLVYAAGLVTGTGQNKPVRAHPPGGSGGVAWATESTYVDLDFQAGDTSKSFTMSVGSDSVRSPAGSRRIIVGIKGANSLDVIEGTQTVVYIHVPEDD